MKDINKTKEQLLEELESSESRTKSWKSQKSSGCGQNKF